MASESSSAVLDMTDECDSHNDCDNDSTPVIMDHGYDIGIKVDAPMKQLSRLETYVSYRVRCSCARWQSPACVRRRYNHFKVLRKRLVAQHPLLPIPPLPALHSARQQLDRYGAKFVTLRAVALEAMLTRIATHPILTHSEHLKLFLTTPDEQIDSVLRAESSPLSLWGLGAGGAAGAGGSVLGHDNNRVRVKEPEFSSAYDYLQSLQQKLTVLGNLTDTLYKSHDALTKLYAGLVPESWAPAESCAVQAAAGALHAAAHRRAAVRAPRTVRAPAVLPLLVTYCHVVQDKIRERDELHAAHLAGSDSEDGIHNRLEQASEALRSELSDWKGKTKAEVKQMLLDVADAQLAFHRQASAAWDHGYRLAAAPPPHTLFKTVSKQCVRNLSPSKLQPDSPPAGSPADTDLDSLSLNDDDNFMRIPGECDRRPADLHNGSTDSDAGARDTSSTPTPTLPHAASDPHTQFSDVDLSDK